MITTRMAPSLDYARNTLVATILISTMQPCGAQLVISGNENKIELTSGAPKVIEVDGKWSINDGDREIDAYLLPNPHATPYLVGYVPDAKLGFVTDIWSPGRGTVTQADPAMVALVRGVEKFGIQPERFAGGHGFVDNYSVLTNAVAKTAAAR